MPIHICRNKQVYTIINITRHHSTFILKTTVEKTLSGTDREQLIAQAMKWIALSGFRLESVPQSNHDFALTFSEAQTLPDLQIIHQQPDSAFFLVVGQVKIPKDDREKLKTVGREFDALIWDIKLSLLRMGVDFTVLGDEKDPDAWEIQTRLFINEGNTTSFYDVCSKVKRALIGVIWSYKRALGTLT